MLIKVELSPAEEKKKRIEKKRKLKEQFNTEYDGEGKGKTYYDDLKQEMDQQAQLNKSEFDGMDDELRVQYEGHRPGMYVRMEIENVACEFVNNFNPTYPVIVGALLSGEENIGFVQVSRRWFHSSVLFISICLALSVWIDSSEETSMAAQNPEDARSSHHFTWMASLSNGAIVLDPGPQWTTQAIEVHTRAPSLYSLVLGSYHSARNGTISYPICISSPGWSHFKPLSILIAIVEFIMIGEILLWYRINILAKITMT